MTEQTQEQLAARDRLQIARAARAMFGNMRDRRKRAELILDALDGLDAIFSRRVTSSTRLDTMPPPTIEELAALSGHEPDQWRGSLAGWGGEGAIPILWRAWLGDVDADAKTTAWLKGAGVRVLLAWGIDRAREAGAATGRERPGVRGSARVGGVKDNPNRRTS